jgi:hypothetical protein
MSGEPNTAWAGVMLSSSLAAAWRPSIPMVGGLSSWLRRSGSGARPEAAVEVFYHPVGLQVVCCRLGMLDV